jgi:hypothetical protein
MIPMKRFVSALIAGAMILSMSVASFADVTFGETETKVDREDTVNNISINWVKIFRDGELVKSGAEGSEVENAEVIAGDTLYFAMNKIGTTENIGGKADKDWRIKVSKASNVEDAEFFYNEKDVANGGIGNADTLWVKVKVSEDFNSYEKDAMNVWFYLFDTDAKTKETKESERVRVGFNYADYAEKTLTENDIKTIVPLELNTIYTLDEDVKSAKVVFGYDDMYITAKLYAGEEYLVNAITTEYNKDMSIKYDTDVNVIEIVSNMDNYDVFFESAKDNKFVYEVDEDELISVDATYMNKYEIIKGEYILTEGYLVENVEDNSWAVLNEEVGLVDIPEEDVKPSLPSTDKTNPETGAGDVVGMASAMAVMAIVAGAGLMISKK